MGHENTFPTLSLKQSCYLDLLRFVAVQLVVFGHLFSFMGIIFTNYALGKNILIQNLGVVIFFILSGYLISYSLFSNMKSKNYQFKDFFKDRFYRIYVTLIPCMIFIIILDLYMPDYTYRNAFNFKTFVGNLFMLQDVSSIYVNYSHLFFIKKIFATFQVTSFGSARPLWTLAVEWWLYMAFGWFFLKIINHDKNTIIKKKSLMPSKLVNFLIFYILLIFPLYNLSGRGNGLTLTWLLGSSVFLVTYTQKMDSKTTIFWYLTGNLICLYMLYFLYSIFGTFYEPRISLLITIWFSLNLAFSNKIKLGVSESLKKALIRLIRLGGGYSYSLYLTHYSIIQFLVNFYNAEENKITLAIVAFFLSNLVAYIIYIIFDKNQKKIKNYSPFKNIALKRFRKSKLGALT